MLADESISGVGAPLVGALRRAGHKAALRLESPHAPPSSPDLALRSLLRLHAPPVRHPLARLNGSLQARQAAAHRRGLHTLGNGRDLLRERPRAVPCRSTIEGPGHDGLLRGDRPRRHAARRARRGAHNEFHSIMDGSVYTSIPGRRRSRPLPGGGADPSAGRADPEDDRAQLQPRHEPPGRAHRRAHGDGSDAADRGLRPAVLAGVEDQRPTTRDEQRHHRNDLRIVLKAIADGTTFSPAAQSG